ncbi:MAG: phasin family protein [Thiohalocapsa sp.]|nr:phasin family protein [Thiohalocapsa sp.]MCF7993075.1 phasin family protein [Thiohalocapsa sp.]
MNTKETVSVINELSNKGIERANALGELNLKMAEQVAARQMDAMSLFLEQSVRMMKLATEAKGYSDYYKSQVEMAKEMTERVMTESKTNMEMAGQMRDGYRGWFDAAMADVKESKDVVRNAVTV